jgi:hypothetical protein
VAQSDNQEWVNKQFSTPAPQRAAKRNDAYRPAETGQGLGTLQGSEQAPSGTYGQAPPAPPYGQPSYSGAPPSAPYGSPPPYGAPVYGSTSPYPASPYGQPQTVQAPAGRGGYNDAYRPPAGGGTTYDDPPPPPAPPYGQGGYGNQGGYGAPPPQGGYAANSGGFGQPYTPPPADDFEPRGDRGYSNRPYDGGGRPPYREERADGTFSPHEIKNAGHHFFGSISQGLASVIEYAFQRQGRPNGYILGEDAGGAFVAGLRYGEGTLYTKDAGTHKVYWQGPSLGYDVGAEGSKVMVLVYNLRDPNEIYDRFGGVAGSAYMIGGVGLNFQTKDHIVLAPIRSGIGLRLGANIGYLKYTPRPTWNPF